MQIWAVQRWLQALCLPFGPFLFDNGNNQAHISESRLQAFGPPPPEAESDALQISRQVMQAVTSGPAECDAHPCDTVGCREYLLCAKDQRIQNG